MYRFGLTGIPLSSKGRMLRDAIEDTYLMGLNALEITFMKFNVMDVDATVEVGLKPKEVMPETKDESKIVIDVLRINEEGNYESVGIDTQIERGDILRILQWNLARSYSELEDLGKIAKELDVKLTFHTPNYIDLVSNDEFTEKSINYIIWSGMLANVLNADMIVTNLGLYGDEEPANAMKKIIQNVKIVRDRLNKMNIKIPIGFETSGKKSVAGSLEELLDVSKKVRNVVPIINFPKLMARSGMLFKSPQDYEKVIQKVEKYFPNGLYVQFASLETMPENMIRLAPIKRGEPKFDFLAELIYEKEYDITIISVSPLLEHDAQYMRVILERIISKKIQNKWEK
ncbi:MAG: TIM barrel protein [Thermoplasmata archaeon]